ncbi:hypothetical protein OU798_07385 [Prolixibacteraceae bacterium Z1-6]|uniref:Uncharacterized protein n=1 Tax=Draconibacterium aestuarii TaxID=2998507 RepID=A0A9X3F428_9BACT|nr:hypothetical protein [Prolixibacteraceae bacterium Z1-6]
MAQAEFNNKGVPLVAFGNRGVYLSTTGAPAPKPKKTAEPKNDDPDKTLLEGIEISDWGTGNRFPTDADTTINSVGVLNSGLKFTRNFTIGQGIFPVQITGYDNDGNEQLKVVDDVKLRNFGKSRMVRRYLEKATRDYLKFGPAFAQLLPNADGSKLVGINTVNAKYSRLSVANSMGTIEKCVVSGKWPDTPAAKNEYSVYDVLDEYDPAADLQRRRWGRQTAGRSFIQVIRDSWSNNEYYSSPVWYSAYTAGWVDIAQKIPAFLQKAYENQITWKWHIQIPYAFWDKKFPEKSFASVKDREDAINAYMDEIEENLCGTANANKPIFTMFELNQQGKVEEQWIIKPLENKLSSEQDLISSAAANSEILFSLMINPNVLGAGMPGGTYAGNQGGSNIREAFLVNIANAWLDRQNLLDPLETFVRFNGAPEDVEWRFRNTILTTLDTGSGTTKTLS